MKVTVTASKVLDSNWATDDEFRELGEAGILELIHEDLLGFLEGASWSVEIKAKGQ